MPRIVFKPLVPRYPRLVREVGHTLHLLRWLLLPYNLQRGIITAFVFHRLRDISVQLFSFLSRFIRVVQIHRWDNRDPRITLHPKVLTKQSRFALITLSFLRPAKPYLPFDDRLCGKDNCAIPASENLERLVFVITFARKWVVPEQVGGEMPSSIWRYLPESVSIYGSRDPNIIEYWCGIYI